MHCSDPEIEKNAQDAISIFFSQNQIIPSPIDARKTDCDINVDLGTPIRIHEEMDISMQSYKSSKKKKDCKNYYYTLFYLFSFKVNSSTISILFYSMDSDSFISSF